MSLASVYSANTEGIRNGRTTVEGVEVVKFARIAAATLAVTMSVALAACDGDGSANSAGSPSTPSGSEIFSGKAPPGGGDAPLLDVDPCTLLSDSDVATTGVEGTADRQVSSDSTRECKWGDFTSAFLTVKLKQGNPESAKPADSPPAIESVVDGRKVLRYTESSSVRWACMSVIVVTPNSYVRVLFSSGRHPLAQACARVDQLLPSVSARIPRP